MLTLLLKIKGCNNASSDPNISKLQLFPIQLNPLRLQGKSNWTGSLCQSFPISQHAHLSPQHFCSLAQHALHITTEAETGSLPRIPSPTLLPTPAISLCKRPFPPSTHILLPHFYHPAEKQKRGEGSRQEGREKDMVSDQCWV